MHLLYTDEVNIDPNATDFFVYAGAAIPGDRAGPLAVEIENLRARHGYQPTDVLKFNTMERPGHISPEVHREIKREILEAAARHEVKLFASFILHNIATSPEDARLNEINRICLHFQYYLGRVGDVGLVLIDTFQDTRLSGHLREKFSVGVVGLPYSPRYRLDRILGFHVAVVGSSHFCSLVDIVLGSLRYGVNKRNDPAKREIAKVLVRQLAPLCIRSPYTGKIEELSIFFSPKTIRVPAYLEAYRELRAFLAEGGVEAYQEPAGEA